MVGVLNQAERTINEVELKSGFGIIFIRIIWQEGRCHRSRPGSRTPNCRTSFGVQSNKLLSTDLRIQNKTLSRSQPP